METENYWCRGRPSMADNPFQLVEWHFPPDIPQQKKKTNATKQCIVCRKRGV